MDQNSKSHHQQHLGINKLGKSIRKSPLHQPNFNKRTPASAQLSQQQSPPPPQPQVYNISKSDFRSIVQQLTGSPARDPAGDVSQPLLSRPPQPKPPSSRLMKNRPPPLTPIPRPQPPPLQNPALNPNPNPNFNQILNTAFYPRTSPSPTAPNGAAWADSPVSAYMRYLETSLLNSGSSRRPPAQGLLPITASFPSPWGNTPAAWPASKQPGMLPSPGSQFPMQSPSLEFPLQSPNSQLPLPSPSSFLNLLSPKSPYPMLSQGLQYQSHFSPNFSFPPTPQPGILGPVPGSQPPPSPNLLFPPSPSGFLPLLSPRWREM